MIVKEVYRDCQGDWEMRQGDTRFYDIDLYKLMKAYESWMQQSVLFWTCDDVEDGCERGER